MSVELPQITQALVDSVFQALVSMEVELDENPLEYGPRRLNKKTADTRRLLSECENLFLRISGWLQKCRSGQRAAESELELEKKHLFANDPEVRAGRNVSTQDAIASMKLRPLVEELAKIRSITEDLEAMLVVVKSKRNDLKDVQRRLGDQIRLCAEEIGLGNKWGTKIYGKTPDLEAAPNKDHQTLTELRAMFLGVDAVSPEAVGEAVLAAESTPALPDPLQEVEEPDEEAAPTLAEAALEKPATGASALLGTGTDADADGFLDSLSVEGAAKRAAKNIDDILKEFDIDV